MRTPCEREGDITAQIASNRTGAAPAPGDRRASTAPGDVIRDYMRPPAGLRRADDPRGDHARSRTAEYRVRGSRWTTTAIGQRARCRSGWRSRSAGGRGRGSTSPAPPGRSQAVDQRQLRDHAVGGLLLLPRSSFPSRSRRTTGRCVRSTVLSHRRARLVNAGPPAPAVAGGNVETSQRIVDVGARERSSEAVPDLIPAASCGTMSNLTLGGTRTRETATEFAYYETIAGGMGARPGGRRSRCDPHPHDQQPQHPGRGARARIPLQDPALRDPSRLRRRRRVSRRRWHPP